MNLSYGLELLREDCGIGGLAIAHLHRESNKLIAILATMASRTRRGLKMISAFPLFSSQLFPATLAKPGTRGQRVPLFHSELPD